MSLKPELVCPAGTLSSLKSAIDAGADTVYVGFRNETNARNFPGLNFDTEELIEGLEYAHKFNRNLYVALNTYPQAGKESIWLDSLKICDDLKVDAVIIADTGLLDYCHTHYPKLRKHLSVQASASNLESIKFFQKHFGIKRLVLPRVLSIKDIKKLSEKIKNIELEVFVYGGLCIMEEGRCSLSSYVTGKSPNKQGVCSPASHVRYLEKNNEIISKLGDFIINIWKKSEEKGYPTICKGRFIINNKQTYAFEDPSSLNAIEILDDLINAGVIAFKIEGRQRGSAYVAQVVNAFKNAINKSEIRIKAQDRLNLMSEGHLQTQGAYNEGWN